MRRALILHPASCCDAVARIEVDVVSAGADRLALTYRVRGSVDALWLPEPAKSARVDDLWRRTCFEAFIQPGGSEGYVEFNLSPSSHWAAYGFTRYRHGMRPMDGIAAPHIETARTATAFELRADLDLTRTALAGRAPPRRVGLSAVIEEVGGRLSYWALVHPADRPDFHHAAGFALEI